MSKKVKCKHSIGERFNIPFIIKDVDSDCKPNSGCYWLESDSGLPEIEDSLDGFWLSEKNMAYLSDFKYSFKEGDVFWVKLVKTSDWEIGEYIQEGDLFLIKGKKISAGDVHKVGERVSRPEEG